MFYVSQSLSQTPQKTLNQKEAILEKAELKSSRLAKALFRQSGIHKRHYIEQQNPIQLCAENIKQLCKQEQVDPKEIDALIYVSSTFGADLPNPSTALFEYLDFSDNMAHYPLIGLGCSAFGQAIHLAENLLHKPEMNHILILCAEMQSPLSPLNANPEDRSQMMGRAIFGDGSVCTLLSKTAKPWKLIDTQITTEPNPAITLQSKEFYVIPKLFEVLKPHVERCLKPLLDRHKRPIDQINHWAIHTGGHNILHSVQQALNLSDLQMAPSFEVYQNYGNLSAASLGFILETISQKKASLQEGDWLILLGFGAGLNISACLLEYQKG